MKQTEYTQAEMQLYITLHNHYKAMTEKYIADLEKEVEELRQSVSKKNERINELTEALRGKDKPKCKILKMQLYEKNHINIPGT